MNQNAPFFRRWLLSAFLAFGVFSSHANTVTWTNTAGGNWSNPLNWNPNQVPGTTSVAAITTAGNYTVTLDVSPSIAGLTLGTGSAGTTQSISMGSQGLTVNGPIQVTAQGVFNVSGGGLAGTNTLTGTMTWSGGSLSGVMTIFTNSVLNIAPGGGDGFNGFTLTNNGTVNWGNTQIFGLNQLNAQIYNYGTWNSQTNTSWTGGYNGGPTIFDNFGIFVKSGGSGTTSLDGNVQFYSTGTISVQSGTLNINVGTNAGGNVSTTGTGNANFYNFTFNNNTTITGTGAYVAGNAVFGGTVIGTLTWDGGNISGVLTLTNSTIFNIIAGGGDSFDGLILTNRGTVNWTNASIYGIQALNAQIYNYGTWNAQSDNSWAGGYNGGTTAFNNIGTFIKSGQGGTTSFDGNVEFTNTGTVNVESGTVTFEAGENNGGSFTATSGTIDFYNFTFTNNTTITGGNCFIAGTAVFDGTVTGTLTWDGGNLSGALNLAASSVFNIVAGGGDSFDGLILTNRGTVNWTNTTIYGINGLNAQIYNLGTWNAESDNTWEGGYNGGTTLFKNSGTFVKSGGSGTITLDTSIVFANTGTIQVKSGTVTIDGGVTTMAGGGNGGISQGGTIRLSTSSNVINFNNYVFGGPTTVIGNGIMTLGGNTTLNGLITVSNLEVVSGEISGFSTLSGNVEWIGGGWDGGLIINSNSSMNIATGGGDGFNGFALTNFGLVTWTNCTIYGLNGSNAQIYNYGTWIAQSDNNWTGGYNGGPTIFDNYGTFTKSGKTGTTILDGNVIFNNTGAVNVQSGTLDIQGAGVNNNGSFATTGSGIINFYAYTFTNTTTFTGTGANIANNCGFHGTVAGPLTWDGGNVTGILTLTNSVFNIVTGGGDSFNGLTLSNYGTVNWTNCTLYGINGSNAQIYNYGTWNAQSDNNWTGGYNGGTTLFDNFGNFVKTGLGGTTALDDNVVFNNTGTVNVDKGTLTINNGSKSGSGTYYVPTGSALNLNNVDLEDGTSVSGDGTVSIGGTSTITGATTIANLDIVGGTISGTSTLTGAVTWSGGSLSGVMTIVSNSTLDIVSGGGDGFSGLILTNYGTVSWTNTAIYGLNGGNAHIYNYGTWDIQSDNAWSGGYNGGLTHFDNFGLLEKTGNGGTTVLDGSVIVSNTGIVSVASGTLNLQGVSTNNDGNLGTSGNGVINYYGFTFTNATTFTGASNFIAGNATFDGTVTGPFSWDNGYLSGVLTLLNNGVLNIIPGGGDGFAGLALTNYGTVNWGPVALYGRTGANAQIYNYGTWYALNDEAWNGGYDGGTTLFDNFGWFIKSGTTGTTTIEGNVDFNNLGTLDSQSGTIALNTYNLTGGALDFGLSSLSSFGQISLAGAAPLTGTLSANLIGGFAPAVGNSFEVLTFTSSSGLFTKTNLPAAAVWKTIYNPANVTIQVQLLRPPLFIQSSGADAILSWPTAFPGYSLQQTASMTPISWSGVTNPVSTVGTNYTVTIPATNTAKYYELVAP
jgi:hypothetical protein